jgi:hypothetical protein
MPYRAAKAGQLKARIGTIKIEKHFTTEAQRAQSKNFLIVYSAAGAKQ